MWDLKPEMKERFQRQVNGYFNQGEDDDVILDMVTLTLHNSSNQIEPDEVKYKDQLLKIVEALSNLIMNSPSTHTGIHVFLTLVTLIVNEPIIAQACYTMIQKIQEQLLTEEIIYDENMLAQYSDYSKFVKDFLD